MKVSRAIEMLSVLDGDEEIWIDWWEREDVSALTNGTDPISDEAWLYAVKRTSTDENVSAEIRSVLLHEYRWAVARIEKNGSV